MGGPDDDDHLHLQWNHHSSTLIQMLNDQLASESLVDVTLSCDGQFLRAHKLVLSSCSPYFQKMFQDFPDKHPIVILKGVSFTDLRTIVDYAYTGQAKVHMDNLPKLLSAAETLQIKGLIEIKSHEDASKGVSPREDALSRPKKRIRERPAKRPTAKARRTQTPVQSNRVPVEPGSQPRLSESPEEEAPSRPVPITASEGVKVKAELPDVTSEESEAKLDGKPDSASSSEDEEPRLMIDVAEDEEEHHNSTPTKPAKRSKRDQRHLPRAGGNHIQEQLHYSAAEPFGMHLDHALDSGPEADTEPDRESTTGRQRRSGGAEKIPRPRNAFMVFGNLWRPKLREQNPGETNTQISIKLGNMWHDMPENEKKVYYDMSRAEAEAHKEKYPNYIYSPKEARENKKNRTKYKRHKDQPLVLAKEPPVPKLLLPKLLLKLPTSGAARRMENESSPGATGGGVDALSLVNVVMPDDARSEEA